MAAEGDDRGGEGREPTALRHVGPATAAVIERGRFDAADIRAGRVSHHGLVEAGVNPGVAERLRREYGLLWAFRWYPGDVDLRRRAAALPDAGPAERRWIATSAGAWQDRPPGGTDDRPDPEPPASDRGADWPAWPEPDAEDTADTALVEAFDAVEVGSGCPRCGGELTRYTLGECGSVLCDACGYAGVPVAHGDEAWRRAVDRIVRGEVAARRE